MPFFKKIIDRIQEKTEEKVEETQDPKQMRKKRMDAMKRASDWAKWATEKYTGVQEGLGKAAQRTHDWADRVEPKAEELDERARETISDITDAAKKKVSDAKTSLSRKWRTAQANRARRKAEKEERKRQEPPSKSTFWDELAGVGPGKDAEKTAKNDDAPTAQQPPANDAGDDAPVESKPKAAAPKPPTPPRP